MEQVFAHSRKGSVEKESLGFISGEASASEFDIVYIYICIYMSKYIYIFFVLFLLTAF